MNSFNLLSFTHPSIHPIHTSLALHLISSVLLSSMHFSSYSSLIAENKFRVYIYSTYATSSAVPYNGRQSVRRKDKNLAIANRSRVSCAHNTLRASIITLWPWNQRRIKACAACAAAQGPHKKGPPHEDKHKFLLRNIQHYSLSTDRVVNSEYLWHDIYYLYYQVISETWLSCLLNYW